MADKQTQIKYWVESADENWKDVKAFFSVGRYLATMYYCQLCIEKLLKAHWVMDNTGNFPPRIHNLVKLHQQTKLNLSLEMIDELGILNAWNIEGRYPEDNQAAYKIATKQYVEEKLKMVEKIRTCLLEKLP